MRLIDADEAVEQINEWLDQTGAIPLNTSYHLELLSCIEDCSTIDAVPVVRGEWEEAKSGVMSVWPPGQVMCSVCGQRMPSQWKKMPPHCYGCGAKMKGENK